VYDSILTHSQEQIEHGQYTPPALNLISIA